MRDIRQTKEWGEYMRRSGFLVEILKKEAGGKARVFIKKIPGIKIALMKGQRFGGTIEIAEIEKLKKKYGVIYSVWEVNDEKARSRLEKYGCRLNKNPFLPTKTLVIDLTRKEREIKSGFSKNAKRILKKIDRKVKVENTDSTSFYQAWKKSGKTWIMSKQNFDNLMKSFGNKGKILISKKGKKILSGVVLLGSKEVINYFQTFTSKEGRRLNSHYLLVWEAIKLAKREGYKLFDFEGIYDPRWPRKKWQGFSEFKKKFGGKEISYPGSMTKWF